jgi:hypothetical protein
MRFHRFSVLGLLAACFPLVLWADDPGAGGGNQPPATDPAKAPPLTQADLDKAVQAAVSAQDAKWTEQFKAATGHDSLQAFQEAEAKRKGEEGKLLEQRNAELTQTRAELNGLRIESALLGAAAEAIDPNTVVALLRGQAKFENGAVTVNGQPAAEAVKALLTEKPFLAKPAGGAGGGAPQNGGGGQKTLSRAEFEKLDPAARQQHLKSGGTVTD